MSHVIGSATDRVADHLFEVPATTLDELTLANRVEHIHLLKIDVEGHELGVIGGARGLFSDERIDVVYIEAGMDPDTTQQVYYRKIEDTLHAYGYRLFRVYEQTHEWPTDSPLIRRVNLCFMSDSFASSRPYKLSRELFRARTATQALTARVADLEREVGGLKQIKDAENSS